ncbi:MAG: histidine phosphatase family protein [Oscillospiraceae bacterium]|nr:histidine phosphatase family protein [Oscillospiraceae bacterium]
MRLYLIRHGESVGNQHRLIFGHSDHPLTDAGIGHAQEAAEKLKDVKISCCYTSTLQRASRTAEICFGGRDIPMVYSDALREQFMGHWEDWTFEDLTDRYPNEFSAMMTDWTHNPPMGGESFDEVYSRVTAYVDEIIARDEDAAIVAHNGPLSMIVTYLLGLNKQSVESFYFFHGCYSVIVVGNGYRKNLNTLECFNK